MKDTEILDLYKTRSENAINETSKQYGAYCNSIAMNIRRNEQDAEEAVNDTYLSAWNAIPPQYPRCLSAYLGRIVRNLSLDKYKSRNAQKRGSSDSATVLLSELEDCIPSARNVEDEADGNELKHVIDSFLETLREEDTVFFMRRYWHGDQIAEIAKRHGVSIGKVKMSLHRTRKKLKEELGKRGYSI